MMSRAKCIDAIENDDAVLLPVQDLPIDNHAQIASQLNSVAAGGFEITKACVMDQTGSRIAEVWNSYKEEICSSGRESDELKGIITAVDELVARLQDPEALDPKATGFHVRIESTDCTTQYIMVALTPSRRSQGLFNLCYHYVEAEKGTTPEQLTAVLINNNTIGYNTKDRAWRYIMEGDGDDQSKKVQSPAGGENGGALCEYG